MTNQQTIQIIGAGLCGSLLALRLGQRGFTVEVFEKRPDLRKVNISAGRSINLAFSNRGIKAINLVGIQHKIEPLCIPMYGRMLHDIDGKTALAPYSGRKNEYINSISRSDLNTLLLDEAEALDNVSFYFNHKGMSVDFENSISHFYRYNDKTGFSRQADVIIGADGAGSVLRKSYYLGKKFRFSFSQDYLNHGYKELSILPANNNTHRIYKNALHIWGRDAFMLIALPNLDGSFTVTLFLSYDEGEYNFNNLTSKTRITEFFSKYFKDALALMPNLIDDFLKNPTSPLGTIKCSPWSYKGNTLLLGDAAHAIVPFYGQGMNAAFEDVVEFDKLLDEDYTNWEDLFKAFETSRKKDTDAIANLAIDNFHEMKKHVNHVIFREKRNLEMAFEKKFPKEYSSKYSLVTFHEEIGYREAMLKGRAQDKTILNMLTNGEIVMPINVPTEALKLLLDKVNAKTKEILEDRVAKNM